ncbi:protein disulfide-isomerase TMX3 isoform X2 [Zootermopsis nevadensis]|uniref:protein disulfide-isomerase TMX3 isoform X2 n=1 Tax=Zootermopsis nevadensis TaxID=136037 RepID=UPI000B8E6B69|nr:protein disulfide-isomerase TMX3 isoform X2 [Zootermopsis nevadensis]
MVLKGIVSLVILGVVAVADSARVLELSDRFLDIRKDGHWLIMFYAPWCAHCKRLEPVWSHVAQALHNTNIRVGRIDCTRFTGMATEFGVSSFPVILFLNGDFQYTFKGDRTKEEIVNFALRVSGPPVNQITRSESLENLKASNRLFFVYVGDHEGPLWETYSYVAERFQPHGFFYSVSPGIARKHVTVTSFPSVFVYKEKLHYFFAEPLNNELGLEYLNASMFDWVNVERFATFPKVTRGNINELLQTKKYLVLAVVEENKLQEIPTEMLVFRDMIQSVIIKNREKFHKHFQFGWVGSPELANSIAMSVVPLPYLLVVNSTTYHHHIPEDDPSQLTAEAVTIFLEQVHNQSAPRYGGNTLPVRLYRTYFKARTSLAEMWYGNPVLTAVLFGLPLGFLSLICYSICCADIMDANDEEDVIHEKKE